MTLKIDEQKLRDLSPSEQEVVLKQLEELEEYRSINPLYFYNHPELSPFPQHKKQLTFHELVRRFRTTALYGGNQSGKTWGGIADNLIQAVDYEILPEHLRQFKKWEPPFYCRIFTPDLSDTGHAFREKVREMVPPSQLMGGLWDKGFDKKNLVLRFKNGSWFTFNSYDQEVRKLGTISLHRVQYDEEPPEEIYMESQPRLVRYNGDQIFTMTPQHGLSWTYDKIWHRAGGEDDDPASVFTNPEKRIAAIVVDLDDNPSLSEEAKESLIEEYGPLMRKARKEGRYVHFSGLVYGEHFNSEKHVKELPPRPFSNKNVNIVVGIDPGWRYTSVIWSAFDMSGHCTVFDELFLENWTIAQVCEQIKLVNAFHEIEPIFYVIDTAARDTSKQTGRSDESEFKANGIYPIPAQKAVSAGINRVQTYFEREDITIGVHVKRLIHELKRYRWKEPPRSGEERTTGIVVKKDDHAVDTLRYILMSRPYLPDEPTEDNRTEEEKWVEEDIKNSFQPKQELEFGGAY